MSDLSKETYQTNSTNLVPDGFGDRDEIVRSSLKQGAMNSTQSFSESSANKTGEQNEITDNSLLEPLNENSIISVRKNSSTEVELQSKNFKNYLADAYDAIQELRKKLVKKMKEVKQYLLGENQNYQQNSKDKDFSLKLYHFQKNADFIIEKNIGEREGKEILQDKVDSILADIENLDVA